MKAQLDVVSVCNGFRMPVVPPPVGPTLAVGCAIGKVTMEQVSRSIMVFYVPMLIVLGLVTYIPALTLWLPNLLLGR